MELSQALILRFVPMLCRRQCRRSIWALNWERAPMYFGVDVKASIQRQAKIRLCQFNECEMQSISYVAMPLTVAIHYALLYSPNQMSHARTHIYQRLVICSLL